MREDEVRFFSEGIEVVGILRCPAGDGPFPGIVQGPGWLGLKDAQAVSPLPRSPHQGGLCRAHLRLPGIRRLGR